MVARTRFIVTTYAHCLPCSIPSHFPCISYNGSQFFVRPDSDVAKITLLKTFLGILYSLTNKCPTFNQHKGPVDLLRHQATQALHIVPRNGVFLVLVKRQNFTPIQKQKRIYRILSTHVSNFVLVSRCRNNKRLLTE